MTKAERVVWAAATMQAVVEAFDHIKKNEAAWRKSMPGSRPVPDREILTRAIRAVEQSLGEHTDIWEGGVQYNAAKRAAKDYAGFIGNPEYGYWQGCRRDPEGRLLHPESTAAMRKPKEIKCG